MKAAPNNRKDAASDMGSFRQSHFCRASSSSGLPTGGQPSSRGCGTHLYPQHANIPQHASAGQKEAVLSVYACRTTQDSKVFRFCRYEVARN
ncbi:hypothetical protein Q31a_12620 [Aureliella helgolandensis]|uniref:Uncharacterized protein n=1 Tax=Aureliella helgolandensis TaxID=2527968 RepID=A0A518G354_9BACT|nr:hypothetical protein Q31a_12620 [Aureliella helgolandensis]